MLNQRVRKYIKTLKYFLKRKKFLMIILQSYLRLNIKQFVEKEEKENINSKY